MYNSIMIEINNLSYIYSENHIVFSDINFDVQKGEFWGILGKNGAGKTTLLDLILGIKFPTNGSIKINDLDLLLSNGEHLEDIVYLSQDVNLNGNFEIDTFLKFNAPFYKNYSLELEKEMLTYFGLNRESKIGSLSTGQQKKVQIVAALAAQTQILIIDEITAVLDPEARFLFFKKLNELKKTKNKTILIATNIAEDLKNTVDKILFIEDEGNRIIKPTEIDNLFVTHDR